jgi:hypothetical protein
MSADDQRDFELPDDLSNEAAAQLIACLYEIARVIENRHFAQIREHYARQPTERNEQSPLRDDDPPF